MTARELDEVQQTVESFLTVRLPAMVSEMTRASLDQIIESKLAALLDLKLGAVVRRSGYQFLATIVAGIVLGSVAWTTITLRVDTLSAENVARKSEIHDIQVDRAETLKEARAWREATSREIAKIGASLDDLKERLPR